MVDGSKDSRDSSPGSYIVLREPNLASAERGQSCLIRKLVVNDGIEGGKRWKKVEIIIKKKKPLAFWSRTAHSTVFASRGVDDLTECRDS